MRDALGSGTTLGYCTNVHAGASFDAMLANLRTHAVAVKRQVSPNQPMGVGLWLSARAAREAVERRRIDELKTFLDEHGLIAFTFNGFPFGDFHQAKVKHAVYEPDWTTQARVDYTLNLAAILARLTPASGEAGISTLPIGWRCAGSAQGTLASAAIQLARVADELATLERDTGVCIHVDLEPEPGCLLDTSSHVVRFFESFLLPGRDEAAIRKHVRVCHDVCHAAVMFEDQRTMIERYRSAGIGIGKVQVSSAIHAPLDELDATDRIQAIDQLSRFAEDRYLHQTVLPSGLFFDDLPAALADAPRDEPWRVHFHVPIDREGFGRLRTTRQAVVELAGMIAQLDCRLFEVETYAWSVLPLELQTPTLADGIARELAWFISVTHEDR